MAVFLRRLAAALGTGAGPNSRYDWPQSAGYRQAMKDSAESRKPRRESAPDEPEKPSGVPAHQVRGDRIAEAHLPSASDSALYQRLVESVQDYAIFALDKEGYIRSWNAGAQRFKGYTAEEAIGKHFSIFYPRELVAEGFPEFELRTAANTGRFKDEGWRLRKDGSRFWANVVITALRDSDGELVGFAKVTRDLTQRRAHEEDLRRSEERFRLLVEGVSEYAIFMLDPNGRVATWNVGAEKIKGYKASEIIGQHFSIFYPEEAREAKWPEHELQVAAERGSFVDNGWRLRKDGTSFWANVTITALRDDTGKLVGYAKLTRDLTESRRIEAMEQVNQQREEMLDA